MPNVAAPREVVLAREDGGRQRTTHVVTLSQDAKEVPGGGVEVDFQPSRWNGAYQIVVQIGHRSKRYTTVNGFWPANGMFRGPWK